MDVASDPGLRQMLQTARAWGVSLSTFLGAKRATTHFYAEGGRLVRSETESEWTRDDREAALALMAYEADLCPGCHQPLEETTRPEHADAYRPGERIRCHYCKAQELIAEVAEKSQDDLAGVLTPIVLDLDVVALNRLPVPPLPPELR